MPKREKQTILWCCKRNLNLFIPCRQKSFRRKHFSSMTMNRLSVYRYLTRYCNGLFSFSRKELAMLNVCCTDSLDRQSQEHLASKDLMMDPEDHCQTIITNSALLPLTYPTRPWQLTNPFSSTSAQKILWTNPDKLWTNPAAAAAAAVTEDRLSRIWRRL